VESEEWGDPVTGDVSREHWTVPMHSLTHADPDGIVQAIARPDGTVSLHMTCGDSQTTGWLDVSRAAQLSTGIWEAAGASGSPGTSATTNPYHPTHRESGR
jgi:hypothetical protein